MISPAPSFQPLCDTLSQVMPLLPNHYADTGVLEVGWFQPQDMLAVDSPWLARGLERQRERYPMMDARATAAFFIGEYSYYLVGPLVAAYMAGQYVPDFSPQNLALRFGKYTWHFGERSGESNRLDVRFLSGRVAALADAPVHHDMVVMQDRAALREWVRGQVEAHVAPLIEIMASVTRLGRTAHWNLVADSCASLFLRVGEALDDVAAAQAEGLAFIKAPDSVMRKSRTQYITLQYDGHEDTFCARGGCCRYYTVNEDARKCATCVLQKPQDRDQILLNFMQKKYAASGA